MWLEAGSKYTPIAGTNMTAFKTTAPWPARRSHAIVATDHQGIYIIGGSGQDVYNDGKPTISCNQMLQLEWLYTSSI